MLNNLHLFLLYLCSYVLDTDVHEYLFCLIPFRLQSAQYSNTSFVFPSLYTWFHYYSFWLTLSKSLSYFLHLRFSFHHLLSLPTFPSIPPLSQVRSHLTADGRTARRSLPGAMNWCDITTCTKGTSPSSSWPSESSVSPCHSFECKHLAFICFYFVFS